jgi:hypothetical protein
VASGASRFDLERGFVRVTGAYNELSTGEMGAQQLSRGDHLPAHATSDGDRVIADALDNLLATGMAPPETPEPEDDDP